MILITAYWASYIFLHPFSHPTNEETEAQRELKQLDQGQGSKVAELDLLPSHLPPKLPLLALCYTQMSTPQFLGAIALALETA